MNGWMNGCLEGKSIWFSKKKSHCNTETGGHLINLFHFRSPNEYFENFSPHLVTMYNRKPIT